MLKKLSEALVALALVSCPAPVFAITYTWQEIPSLGGNQTYPLAMNDVGDVVGTAQVASGEFHAFLSRNGTTTDLGTLGGNQSLAAVINNQGVIAGTSREAGNATASVFISGGGSLKREPLSAGSGDLLRVAAINDRGQILVVRRTAGASVNEGRSFRVAGGRVTPLPAELPVAVDFTADGGVLGYAKEGSQVRTLVLSKGEITTPPGLRNLDATPAAVNARGEIVGTLAPGGVPFVWRRGTVTTLRFERATMIDVNDLGMALGSYPRFDFRLGFCLESLKPLIVRGLTTAQMASEAPFFVSNLAVTAINNRGEMVGTGRVGTGEVRAYRFTPRPAVLISGERQRQTTAARFVIQGFTVGDVKELRMSVNQGPSRRIGAAGPWRVPVRLRPGQNRFDFWVLDSSGRRTFRSQVQITRSEKTTR